MLLCACGATREGAVPASAEHAAAGDSLSAEVGDEPMSAAAALSKPAGQQESSPLPRPLPEPNPFGDHVTPTEIVAPDSAPVGEGDGVLVFPAFGPAPGSTSEQFGGWAGVIEEFFLGSLTEERRLELEQQLRDIPIVDATPAFINALRGLDMANPEHIVQAGALTKYWYEAQIRYKQIVLDGNPAALLPGHVRNRMLVVDGWVRMWKRTLEQPGGVARFNARVSKLIADRKAARDKQAAEYLEKVRLREEAAAAAEQVGPPAPESGGRP